jgi:N-acetylglutamate synthase-like GNAT family acetyltransferase
MSFSVIGTADNELSLIRINQEDEESTTTTSWIQQAETLLMQQWPRGGPYREKLLYSSSTATCSKLLDESSSYYTLPCSYLLMQHMRSNNHNVDVCVGHGRLTECFESAGGNAVAATFVMVDRNHRGCGLGSAMMKLLEQEAERLGYHYVYLWTQTAISFYQKNGYSECQRVSLKRACLKSLEPSQVDGLEAMLFKKSQKSRVGTKKATAIVVPKETILLPPAEDDAEKALEDVWLRKRLVEHVGSVHVPVADRIQEIASITKEHDKNYAWYYQLLSVPWQAQIGPSCGLAALRMVREYFLTHSSSSSENEPQQLPSLLGEAQERGYTNDGEVFNATHLADLADSVCGIETELWTTREVSPKRLTEVLSLGGVFVLPYDSKPGAYYPVNLAGQRAHYGIVVGILLRTESDDNEYSLETLDVASRPIDDNVVETVYVIVQHSLSQSLMIAPMNEFWESNQQLLSVDEGKFGMQDLDLKDRIVVCKEIRPDYI